MPRKVKKTPSKKNGKHYTFTILVTFEMQNTFTGDEVESAIGDGDPDGFEPTDEALIALGEEFQEYLGQNYSVEKVDVSTDSDLLLGINDAT